MGSILLSCGSLDYKTTNVLSYNPRVSCALAHFFCLIFVSLLLSRIRKCLLECILLRHTCQPELVRIIQ